MKYEEVIVGYSLPDWVLTIVSVLAVFVLYLGAACGALAVWFYEEENKTK